MSMSSPIILTHLMGVVSHSKRRGSTTIVDRVAHPGHYQISIGALIIRFTKTISSWTTTRPNIIQFSPLAIDVKIPMGTNLVLERLVFIQPVVRLVIMLDTIHGEMLVEKMEFENSNTHLNNSFNHHNTSQSTTEHQEGCIQLQYNNSIVTFLSLRVLCLFITTLPKCYLILVLPTHLFLINSLI